jgi:hypothetical protein
MYTCIFQNSYVILIITFIVLYIFFYLFDIGYHKEIRDKDHTVVKKFGWKYPLAISLLVWVIWHFYLYPPAEEICTEDFEPIVYNKKIPAESSIQKINMINWT